MRRRSPSKRTRTAAMLTLMPLLVPGPSFHDEPEPAPIVAASASPAQRSAADGLVGRYHFAGGEAQRKAVDEAIDDVVAEMNPLVRSIARDRLARGNRVPDALHIERDGDTLVVAFDDRRHRAALDGSTTTVTGSDGDPLRYSIAVTPGSVHQAFVGDRGRRDNVLVKQDGKVVVDVTVTSKQLPKALRYRLAFAK